MIPLKHKITAQSDSLKWLHPFQARFSARSENSQLLFYTITAQVKLIPRDFTLGFYQNVISYAYILKQTQDVQTKVMNFTH